MAQPEGTPEFAFKGMKVRAALIDGEPWFVAPDVLRVLGMDAAQVANYLRHLNTDEKQLVKRNPLNQSKVVDIDFGRASHFTFISESGLYKLIMRSDKPEAKGFQDWVTRVVLPTIRKKLGTQPPSGAT